MATIKQKIDTLISNPHGVFDKYIVDGIKRVYYSFSGMLMPYLGEDYEIHWNYTPFDGKTVLDLGADYGSTAAWFHQKGSISVIAVEADPKLYKKLQNYSKNKIWLNAINDCIDSSQKIDELIACYLPDIVKVDIEGAEAHLVDCAKLSNVSTWLIEVHSDELKWLLTYHFQKNGFTVENVADLNCGVLFIHKNIEIQKPTIITPAEKNYTPMQPTADIVN